MFIPEGVFQRFQGTAFAEMTRMCVPSLQDLLNQQAYMLNCHCSPLRALKHSKVESANPRLRKLCRQGLVAAMPDRLRKAVDEAVSLYLFFEKKSGVNFAPVFAALFGVIDERQKGW